ncbi:MAG: peroxiredoxin family protein [Persicimonas sp.]
MILRKKHWPLLIALCICGPALGLAVGYFAGWPSCPKKADRPVESNAPDVQNDHDERRADHRVILPNDRETELALDEIAPGRPVALVVMKHINCPVCQDQLVELTDRLDQVQRTGGAVYGLSTSEPAANQRLMQEKRLGFPVLTDVDRSLHREVGLWSDERGHAVPGVVFLDEDGQVRDVHRGRYPNQPQEGMILKRLEAM